MNNQHILLIDDDEDDQEIFLTALDSVNSAIQCSVEKDANEALLKLARKQIITDLIFLDLNMPGMNGQQFLAQIKKDEELKKIPVFIFSTTSQSGTIKQAKELGAHDFITKPDKFDDLITILTRIIT